MKVIQVPFGFAPDPIGGTEVYVESLAHELQRQGVDVEIAAPGATSAQYSHANLTVHRFPVGQRAADLRDLYGQGDRQAARSFGQLLDASAPDVVHLHAFTRGVSVLLVREAKRRGIPVVFTYHTPTVACQRGTLMRWGTVVCDGLLERRRCTACTLHGLGLPAGAGLAIASLPRGLGRVIAESRVHGGIWTALQMPALVELRQSAFRWLVREVDHLVAVCAWARELLVRNSVPADKITLARHALPDAVVASPGIRPSMTRIAEFLRLAYVGRLDPSKGPLVLIQALRRIPEAPIHLDLYGIVQEGNDDYARTCRDAAAGDRRVTFRAPLANEEVVPLLSHYDALAVPSQWLETGPLVVLEAFAAGVPVVGSGIGGIAELVHDGIDGLLVHGAAASAWARTLTRLVSDAGLLVRLKSGVQPPRRMSHLTNDMLTIYGNVLRRRPANP